MRSTLAAARAVLDSALPAALVVLSVVVAALAAAWALPARAHVTSTGLATLDVDGPRLVYRILLVATEVDDQAGRLLWLAGEGDRDAADRVAGFLRDHVHLAIDGEPCRPESVAIERAPAGIDRVVLGMALACARSGRALAIRDEWPEVLGAHFQTRLSLRQRGRPPVALVFFEARRSATVDLAGPAGTGGWAAFVGMGFDHVLGSADHVLFLVALLACVRGLGASVRIVTAFTVALSVALGLAGLGLVEVPAAVAEPLIAASIVWMAIENLLAPARAGQRWLAAGLFGLVYGLGFASALADLDLQGEALLRAIIGFDFGAAIGHLVVVVVLLPLLALATRSHRLAGLPRFLSIAVALVGAFSLARHLADIAI